MNKLELKAEPREVIKGQAKHLRADGLVPGVLYGREIDTRALQFNARDLGKILSVAGTFQLINLQIGQEEPIVTLAREIQQDVIRRDYLHVDLYAVKMDEKVNAQVPIVLQGTSPAVRDQGGVLTQGLDELDIECLPADLIASFEVDISGLEEFNDTIIVSELSIPPRITVLSEPESMVAKIEPPRKEEELEALEEVDEFAPVVSAEPEVITEAKDDDDEEEFPEEE